MVDDAEEWFEAGDERGEFGRRVTRVRPPGAYDCAVPIRDGMDTQPKWLSRWQATCRNSHGGLDIG
ncbi:hypothetical protein GCM10023317_50530 [Actinopolymorpha pittospori]